MAIELWAITILKIFAVIVGGHLAITILLPALKNMLVPYIKKEEFITSLMSIFLFYIGILVLKFVVEFLAATGSKFLSYGSILTPGIDVILTVAPYVFYFMIGAIIVAGLKK